MQPMAVYLAARFERKPDMEAVAEQFRDAGFVVTSRWHQPGVHEWNDTTNRPPDDLMQRFADEDLDDVYASDALVLFTEPPGTYSRGGRHVEWGYAVGAGITTVLVGQQRENIFQEGSPLFSTPEEAIDYLKDDWRNRLHGLMNYASFGNNLLPDR